MNKLKRLLGTVVFLGIALLLFQTFSYLLRPAEDVFHRSDITGFYGEKDESLDVVVFGGSAANYYINNPILWEETQLTSYDFTTPDQSCFMVEYLIDEVEKTQSPQLYIVETRKFIKSESKEDFSERLGLVIDNMRYSKNRIDLIDYMVEDWEERVNYYFDIISYHDSWEDFSYDNLKYINNIYKDPYKGWDNKTRHAVIKEPNILPMEDYDAKPIAEKSEEALCSLLEKCQEENIQVLFVATPYKISKKDQKKNLYIKHIIEEAGFLFLDCNQYLDEIGLDFSVDYLDPRHVNMLGSEKTTRFIGQYIQQNYQLSTEHDVDVTKDWNAYAERNRAEAEELEKEIWSQVQESKEEK